MDAERITIPPNSARTSSGTCRAPIWPGGCVNGWSWSRRPRSVTIASAARAGAGARVRPWPIGSPAVPRAEWKRWQTRRVPVGRCARLPPPWRPWNRPWRRRRAAWAWPSTSGPRTAWRPLRSRRPGGTWRPAGCGGSWRSRAGCAGGPSIRSLTGTIPPPWPLPAPRWRRWGEQGRAEPERDALQVPDETPLEPPPHRCRTGHRRGHQPTQPAAAARRRGHTP
jgi:hypothetical protein